MHLRLGLLPVDTAYNTSPDLPSFPRPLAGFMGQLCGEGKGNEEKGESTHEINCWFWPYM